MAAYTLHDCAASWHARRCSSLHGSSTPGSVAQLRYQSAVARAVARAVAAVAVEVLRVGVVQATVAVELGRPVAGARAAVRFDASAATHDGR